MTTALLLLACLCTSAQQFFNLTAEEVRVDTLLPRFTYLQELGSDYADSVYTVSIDYPEFIDMSPADVKRYHAITGDTLPELPEVEQYIGVSRKRGTLYVSMVPLVFRDGRYQKLVSFMLAVKSTPRAQLRTRSGLPVTRSDDSEGTAGRYADHSVLAEGRWVKIGVPATGVYQLTDAVLRRAGFSDYTKVRVYGYGGALQPERLTGDYLKATDDLQEVAQCMAGGKRLFYAQGPVSWSSTTANARTRNPYSIYGYYFLTDGEPLTVTEEEFKAAHYPTADDYHSLIENEGYAWFTGGRNLFDPDPYTVGNPRQYKLYSAADSGTLTVALTYDGVCATEVLVNDSLVGTIQIQAQPNGQAQGLSDYNKAAEVSRSFVVKGLLTGDNTVTVRQLSGSTVRLDYLSLCYAQPRPWADLQSTTFSEPEVVCQITNQDHHADGAADMVIIIPTTQKLLVQAERLKTWHEQRDTMTVHIVPADELFNEFSSGTPDANAYRRYLKMLYDRAKSDGEMPRYLLLLGDGAWDNRMLSSAWSATSSDDLLLCYESENSFSEVSCYVSDDYFCLLDDDEGGNMLSSDRPDVAVGRLPARTAAEAQVMVDKILSYAANAQAGAWQNTICLMGDDGNNNLHMQDAEAVASLVEQDYPDFQVKKIYWDAYTRTASATGFSYPDVTRLIKQQMQSGALIMNYSGHGAPYCLSHEQVIKLADFAAPTSLRLPLWLTASCDIMPFDGQQDNIGETAMLNKQGGAVAFYGTTRTVYAHYNRYMNRAFMRHVLSTVDGRRVSIGEAARLAKNELIQSRNDLTENKLQYTLLGDPALVLAAPTVRAVIDSIGGKAVTDGADIRLLAGMKTTVSGHIVGSEGVDPAFNGVASLTVNDAEQTITCKLNDETADNALVFTDRGNTLYEGSDSVSNGLFSFTFAVPKDISYTEGNGLMTVYAVNSNKTREAHGTYEQFALSGDSLLANDGIGPNIYCYLNSPSFVYGGTVNASPYFYAELEDGDGINVSGSGIGHDLQLIIDGEPSKTYTLNDYFRYDFGDYRRGTVGYSIPALSAGQHKLQFRAWDVLNNSSVAELAFSVDATQEPSQLNVSCTHNPATTATTFIISHDRTGAMLDVELDIYDMAGRMLWKHTESGLASTSTYTIDWDLTVDGGRRLQTGVYLYRVAVSSDGSGEASQAKKLVILYNK